jgi:hypothetical protein
MLSKPTAYTWIAVECVPALALEYIPAATWPLVTARETTPENNVTAMEPARGRAPRRGAGPAGRTMRWTRSGTAKLERRIRAAARYQHVAVRT